MMRTVYPFASTRKTAQKVSYAIFEHYMILKIRFPVDILTNRYCWTSGP